ncbi:MAG: hypothetical protein N3A54_00600 [Patescibacteria group bacterium]|nr:hypothetical protein [Patescibacteria group bacterium]
MILLEYTREQTLNQFSSFFEKNKEVIKALFQTPENFLSHLETLDPNHGSELVNTMINFINKGILDFHDLTSPIPVEYVNGQAEEVSLEDFLKKHDLLKRKKALSPQQMDLNKIRKRRELVDLIRTVKNYPIITEKKGEFALLFTGKNGTRFIESFDEIHACYVGRGSLWCTATTKSDNKFNLFKSMGYRVITFIPKKPGNEGREKYQFNLWGVAENYTKIKESGPFMFPQTTIFDYKNEPVDLLDLQPPIYEDLIDFLFFTFDHEIDTYFDIFLPKSPTYDALFEFIQKDLGIKNTFFMDHVFIPIYNFIKNTQIRTYSKNTYNQIKESLKDKGNYITSNFVPRNVIPLIFDLCKILKCFDLMSDVAKREQKHHQPSIENKEEYIKGSFYDLFLYSCLKGDLFLMMNWLNIAIQGDVFPYGNETLLSEIH